MFAAWTAPYVLFTFFANAVAPSTLGSVFRTPTLRGDVITTANGLTLLMLACAEACAIVMAWQGAWLGVALTALGAATWLPRHLVAPCAVAVVAALEASRIAGKRTPVSRARRACIAAASLWLGAQAVVTGSLWGCVGTAFAGILAALWCTRAGRGAAAAPPPPA